MNHTMNTSLLSIMMKRNGQVNTTISGSSMHPIFKEGDIVTIRPSAQYLPGDILLYPHPYDFQNLVIHRLLQGEQFFCCKGDNAFKTEIVAPKNIIGKAVMVNSDPIPPWQDWQIYFSSLIAQIFMQNHQDYTITMQTPAYQMYSNMILHKTSRPLYYVLNPDAAYIPWFSQDRHNYPQITTDIFSLLTTPCTLDHLFSELFNIKPDTTKTCCNDIMMFLINAVANDILLCSYSV